MAVLLIAEDEKDMQNIIVDFMKQGGHSCILANDGVEALSILENAAEFINIPQQLKDVLLQLRDKNAAKAEEKEESEE